MNENVAEYAALGTIFASSDAPDHVCHSDVSIVVVRFEKEKRPHGLDRSQQC